MTIFQKSVETMIESEVDITQQEMYSLKGIEHKHETSNGEKIWHRVPDRGQQIKWTYVIYFTVIHVLAIIGVYYFFIAKYQTIIFCEYSNRLIQKNNKNI